MPMVFPMLGVNDKEVVSMEYGKALKIGRARFCRFQLLTVTQVVRWPLRFFRTAHTILACETYKRYLILSFSFSILDRDDKLGMIIMAYVRQTRGRFAQSQG